MGTTINRYPIDENDADEFEDYLEEEEFFRKPSIKKRFSYFFPWGAIVIGVVIVAIIFFVRTGKQQKDKEVTSSPAQFELSKQKAEPEAEEPQVTLTNLATLQKRVEEIEARLAKIEELTSGLDTFIEEYEQRNKILSKRVDQLNDDFNAIIDQVKKRKTPSASITTHKTSSAKKGLKKPIYHIVKPGDTLYRIGRRYNIGLEELKRINRLSSNNIKVGQKLVVGYK